MAIAFACPGCTKPFRVPDEMAGRPTKCPSCGTSLLVPGMAAPPPPPPQMNLPGQLPMPMANGFPGDPLAPAPRAGAPWKALGFLGAGILLGLLILGLVGGGLWYFVFSSSGPTEARYLPSDCEWIITIKPAQLLESEAGKDLMDALSAEHKEMLSIPEKKLGLRLKDIKQVTIAGTFGKLDDMVTIFKAKDLDGDDIKKTIEAGGSSFDQLTVGDFTIHKDRSSPFAFAVIDGKILILGNADTLQAILERDKKPELSADMQNAMKLVDFGKTFAAAADLRSVPEPDKALRGGNPVIDLVRTALRDKEVEGLGLQIETGTEVTITITGTCKDSSTAEDYRRMIDGAVVWAKKSPHAANVARSAEDLADACKVTTSGAKVVLQCKTKTNPLVAIYKEFTGKK